MWKSCVKPSGNLSANFVQIFVKNLLSLKSLCIKYFTHRLFPPFPPPFSQSLNR